MHKPDLKLGTPQLFLSIKKSVGVRTLPSPERTLVKHMNATYEKTLSGLKEILEMSDSV